MPISGGSNSYTELEIKCGHDKINFLEADISKEFQLPFIANGNVCIKAPNSLSPSPYDTAK